VRLLLKLWHSLPDQVRFAILRVVQRNNRLYRWLMFRHADVKDQVAGDRAHLPPAEMRYRVGASPDAEEFITIGKTCAADIQSAVLKVGCELGSFTRILDFGCGCGRTVVHMRDLAPAAQIDGIDIDADAIEWCTQNLNFASFSVGKETPPSDYAVDTFDFIYVISVFTHLDEDYQFRWLEELRRIAKPGAVLVLTVNGIKDGLKDSDKGFVFERSYEEGLFPAWYQNTYHSKEYVFENFGKYFAVLGYFPQSMNAHQDVVVLQKATDKPG
jgi:SAM-dependent methyltransferase